MKIERACYSFSAVLECLRAIKTLNANVQRREEHFAKFFELKKLYDLCYEKTGCLMFDVDWSPLKDYQKDINDGLCERTRKVSKKEYDEHAKRCVRYLKREMYDIYKSMLNGDVDTVD